MRILLFLALISCSNDPRLVQGFVPAKELPTEEMKEVELIQTENGNIKVKILASSINRFHNIYPDVIFSNGFSVSFYNDSLRLQSTLKAENASMNNKTKIMIASNNVILENNKDRRLETEELTWDEMSNKIYTDKNVKITTGKEVIFGEGFISTPDFSEYSILNIYGSIDFNSKEE